MGGEIHRVYSRRAIVLGGCVAFAGCIGDGSGDSPADGDDSTLADGDQRTPTATDTDDTNPATGEVTQQGELRLTSPAFDDGGPIPEQYGYDADNVNPPLEIANVPQAAESLALGVDDPDAVEPAGQVWDHWVVWNIPPDRREIPEGWRPETAVEGTNDFEEVGYGGPSPPDGQHRYRFKCFALDTTLELPESTDLEGLGEAMSGHVLAGTQLDGTFSP